MFAAAFGSTMHSSLLPLKKLTFTKLRRRNAKLARRCRRPRANYQVQDRALTMVAERATMVPVLPEENTNRIAYLCS